MIAPTAKTTVWDRRYSSWATTELPIAAGVDGFKQRLVHEGGKHCGDDREVDDLRQDLLPVDAELLQDFHENGERLREGIRRISG